MRHDIPMLNSNTLILLLRTPRRFLPHPLNRSIQADESYALVVNELQLEVYSTTPITTTCRGKLCDKQRLSDWNLQKDKGCGYYSMHQNAPSTAIKHALSLLNP